MAPAVLGGCDRQSGENAQPELSGDASGGGEALTGVIDRSHKGSPLPEFTLADPQGDKLDLRSLKGKPALINLWATWCAPCVAELPTLDKIANRADMNLQVVTISQDTGGSEKVRAFLDERGFAQLPAWLDPENDLTFHYGTGTLPTTVLYDAEGKEVWRFVGGHDWTSAESAEMLAEAN
ncbi:MAG: TlpA disulfide reductase family protein [Novosphingobium sp.]